MRSRRLWAGAVALTLLWQAPAFAATPQIGSILGTAGGLIFEGGRDRRFRASDERTGKVLWQFRLNASPSSSPIAYSVDGVQYIAVTAGGGASLDGYVGGVMAPEIAAPASGTTLWVFRVPDKK